MAQMYRNVKEQDPLKVSFQNISLTKINFETDLPQFNIVQQEEIMN